MYDVIGDIHGYADKLTNLLKKMGYEIKGGHYVHPTRKAVFLGDFIDRGPKIRETIRLVRGIVEAGTALSVMGNHEFNALCFHTPDPNIRRLFAPSQQEPPHTTPGDPGGLPLGRRARD